jgi:hypothetical protein
MNVEADSVSSSSLSHSATNVDDRGFTMTTLSVMDPRRSNFQDTGKISTYFISWQTTFSSTAIEIIRWVKKIAVAQAKVSHILRPGNTAFKEQLKLVNGFKR